MSSDQKTRPPAASSSSSAAVIDLTSDPPLNGLHTPERKTEGDGQGHDEQEDHDDQQQQQQQHGTTFFVDIGTDGGSDGDVDSAFEDPLDGSASLSHIPPHGDGDGMSSLHMYAGDEEGHLGGLGFHTGHHQGGGAQQAGGWTGHPSGAPRGGLRGSHAAASHGAHQSTSSSRMKTQALEQQARQSRIFQRKYEKLKKIYIAKEEEHRRDRKRMLELESELRVQTQMNKETRTKVEKLEQLLYKEKEKNRELASQKRGILRNLEEAKQEVADLKNKLKLAATRPRVNSHSRMSSTGGGGGTGIVHGSPTSSVSTSNPHFGLGASGGARMRSSSRGPSARSRVEEAGQLEDLQHRAQLLQQVEKKLVEANKQIIDKEAEVRKLEARAEEYENAWNQKAEDFRTSYPNIRAHLQRKSMVLQQIKANNQILEQERPRTRALEAELHQQKAQLRSLVRSLQEARLLPPRPNILSEILQGQVDLLALARSAGPVAEPGDGGAGGGSLPPPMPSLSTSQNATPNRYESRLGLRRLPADSHGEGMGSHAVGLAGAGPHTVFASPSGVIRRSTTENGEEVFELQGGRPGGGSSSAGAPAGPVEVGDEFWGLIVDSKLKEFLKANPAVVSSLAVQPARGLADMLHSIQVADRKSISLESLGAGQISCALTFAGAWLGFNESLRRIVIKDCAVSRRQLDSLMDLVGKAGRFEYVRITRCALGADHMRALSRAIWESPLETLDLSYNSLQAEGAKALAKAFVTPPPPTLAHSHSHSTGLQQNPSQSLDSGRRLTQRASTTQWAPVLSSQRKTFTQSHGGAPPPLHPHGSSFRPQPRVSQGTLGSLVTESSSPVEDSTPPPPAFLHGLSGGKMQQVPVYRRFQRDSPEKGKEKEKEGGKKGKEESEPPKAEETTTAAAAAAAASTRPSTAVAETPHISSSGSSAVTLDVCQQGREGKETGEPGAKNEREGAGQEETGSEKGKGRKGEGLRPQSAVAGATGGSSRAMAQHTPTQSPSPPSAALVACTSLGSLRELRLPVNQLGDKGAVAVAEILRGGSLRALRVMDLRWNDIRVEGATALACALGPSQQSSRGIAGASASSPVPPPSLACSPSPSGAGGVAAGGRPAACSFFPSASSSSSAAASPLSAPVSLDLLDLAGNQLGPLGAGALLQSLSLRLSAETDAMLLAAAERGGEKEKESMEGVEGGTQRGGLQAGLGTPAVRFLDLSMNVLGNGVVSPVETWIISLVKWCHALSKVSPSSSSASASNGVVGREGKGKEDGDASSSSSSSSACRVQGVFLSLDWNEIDDSAGVERLVGALSSLPPPSTLPSLSGGSVHLPQPDTPGKENKNSLETGGSAATGAGASSSQEAARGGGGVDDEKEKGGAEGTEKGGKGRQTERAEEGGDSEKLALAEQADIVCISLGNNEISGISPADLKTKTHGRLVL
uniref:Uncharacterized protein n=1 Tax=Chromera velia CCMP2878 TaxID=1169474 RepID=A0A0G4G746_9ALVE|eukprot:Cvel_20596.t1-p1 / transcript=Cvel_20596.t1 / gene=Cvel_20596 / organism=Chromera_velia_CCMP2878 / gene_product=hypothetical protein / transcript_product=hypothetical protein / location=Cvel_scaffold1862:2436-14904(+) / protein_length=1433 / sequence_SO=supercontig / SO=protein_coding / is_pseudo=false